nr:uncharacterized protein LOC131774326 isoform X2 [Pocillopora verrucosa]
MVTLPWEVDSSLSPHILEHLSKISPCQFINSKNQCRLPEGFSSYVDQSIYELGLESFYSSGDGNCFYNSLSILVSGHESDIEIFRLGAAMYGLAHYDHIVDANATHFTDRGDALQWAASVSLSPNEVQEIKDKSIPEIVAKR